jgi:hypothetical protein
MSRWGWPAIPWTGVWLMMCTHRDAGRRTLAIGDVCPSSAPHLRGVPQSARLGGRHDESAVDIPMTLEAIDPGDREREIIPAVNLSRLPNPARGHESKASLPRIASFLTKDPLRCTTKPHNIAARLGGNINHEPHTAPIRDVARCSAERHTGLPPTSSPHPVPHFPLRLPLPTSPLSSRQ